MGKGPRRRRRSDRSGYKKRRRYNNQDPEIEPAPVRVITLEELPEDSALRRSAVRDTTES